jgi:hypothetical protein
VWRYKKPRRQGFSVLLKKEGKGESLTRALKAVIGDAPESRTETMTVMFPIVMFSILPKGKC